MYIYVATACKFLVKESQGQQQVIRHENYIQITDATIQSDTSINTTKSKTTTTLHLDRNMRIPHASNLIIQTLTRVHNSVISISGISFGGRVGREN